MKITQDYLNQTTGPSVVKMLLKQLDTEQENPRLYMVDAKGTKIPPYQVARLQYEDEKGVYRVVSVRRLQQKGYPESFRLYAQKDSYFKVNRWDKGNRTRNYKTRGDFEAGVRQLVVLAKKVAKQGYKMQFTVS